MKTGREEAERRENAERTSEFEAKGITGRMGDGGAVVWLV